MSRHRDDRKFLPTEDLAEQRTKAHRTFRISDPAALAIVLIVAAIAGGLFRAGCL